MNNQRYFAIEYNLCNILLNIDSDKKYIEINGENNYKNVYSFNDNYIINEPDKKIFSLANKLIEGQRYAFVLKNNTIVYGIYCIFIHKKVKYNKIQLFLTKIVDNGFITEHEFFDLSPELINYYY